MGASFPLVSFRYNFKVYVKNHFNVLLASFTFLLTIPFFSSLTLPLSLFLSHSHSLHSTPSTNNHARLIQSHQRQVFFSLFLLYTQDTRNINNNQEAAGREHQRRVSSRRGSFIPFLKNDPRTHLPSLRPNNQLVWSKLYCPSRATSLSIHK